MIELKKNNIKGNKPRSLIHDHVKNSLVTLGNSHLNILPKKIPIGLNDKDKSELLLLIKNILEPTEENLELLLLPPRKWTKCQYKTMLGSNHYLAPYLCSEWERVYISSPSTQIINPPTKRSILKDIYGIEINKSLIKIAKLITKTIAIYDTNTAITAFKRGLNFLPPCFGCKSPNLQINGYFDDETKQILIENIARRGINTIQESYALGIIATILRRKNNLRDASSVHNLFASNLAPLFLESRTSERSIWKNALVKSLNIDPKQSTNQSKLILLAINTKFEQDELTPFIKTLATNLGLFSTAKLL